MSNSSLMGSIKKRYQSLISIFSKSDSDSKNTPQRINAFNMKRNRRNQFATLLAQKEVVKQLVNLYRQNDCLWNTNCPDYNSAECQERVWREIATAIDVNMPVVQVKRKVLVLRSQWEAFKDLPIPKPLDYPDLSFLNDELKTVPVVERVNSGSEQTQLQFLEKSQETEANIPSESKIINKSHHISNLCEVVIALNLLNLYLNLSLPFR